jgi:membrane protease YdiL (CAAX protease family)
MNALATRRPVSFVFILIITWLVLLVAFMGIAASALHAPHGGAVTVSTSRLAVTACVLFLLRRLGWLQASGVARSGSWYVWALASGGMFYFAGSSLYSFYGRMAFDFSNLIRSPDSPAAVTTILAGGLSEEILFRGLALYALIRVWGNTRKGIVGSVAFISLLFAVLHIMQAFTNDLSLPAVLLLTLETFVISIWWGALVVWGGSIWPAVMVHFVGNAVVAVQGLTVPMVEPTSLAYAQTLWFSLPLGVLGIGLLVRKRECMQQQCERCVSTIL